MKQLLTQHGVEFRVDVGTAKYPVKLQVRCPCDDSHVAKDAYVFQDAAGAFGFHCPHSACRSNGWQDFKAAVGIETQKPNHDEKTKSHSEFVDECPPKHGAKRAIVDNLDEFIPFPIDELPPDLTKFCREVAAAVGCDESYPAIVCLAACSAAIGTSRQLCVKFGWFVPPVIWAVLVGESGTQKSPPFRMAMAPLKNRQERDAEDRFPCAHSSNNVPGSPAEFRRRSRLKAV